MKWWFTHVGFLVTRGNHIEMAIRIIAIIRCAVAISCWCYEKWGKLVILYGRFLSHLIIISKCVMLAGSHEGNWNLNMACLLPCWETPREKEKKKRAINSYYWELLSWPSWWSSYMQVGSAQQTSICSCLNAKM